MQGNYRKYVVSLVAVFVFTILMQLAVNQWWAWLGRREEQDAQRHTQTLSKYSVIHKRGSCPPGWTMERDLFLEEDGSKRDACRNPEPTEFPIDYRAPGEMMAAPLVRKTP